MSKPLLPTFLILNLLLSVGCATTDDTPSAPKADGASKATAKADDDSSKKSDSPKKGGKSGGDKADSDDDMSEADACAVDLALAGAAAEMRCDLVHVRDPGGTDRMPL